jgi:hypothetical protein
MTKRIVLLLEKAGAMGAGATSTGRSIIAAGARQDLSLRCTGIHFSGALYSAGNAAETLNSQVK